MAKKQTKVTEEVVPEAPKEVLSEVPEEEQYDTAGITDEELLEFLEKREVQNEKRKQYTKDHPDQNQWARQKAKMASDPEYAERVKAQRKAYQEKRKAKMDADPEFAKTIKAQRTAYQKKRNAYFKALEAEAKARGMITE